MKFIDPSEVTCEVCSAASMQRVDDLLSLRAICPNCGNALEAVGQGMRAMVDEFTAWVSVAGILIMLEDKLGVQFGDDELFETKTLRDIAQAVERRLSMASDRQARSVQFVIESARRIGWCTAVELALEVPVLDAIDPTRWERRSKNNGPRLEAVITTGIEPNRAATAATPSE